MRIHASGFVVCGRYNDSGRSLLRKPKVVVLFLNNVVLQSNQQLFTGVVRTSGDLQFPLCDRGADLVHCDSFPIDDYGHFLVDISGREFCQSLR